MTTAASSIEREGQPVDTETWGSIRRTGSEGRNGTGVHATSKNGAKKDNSNNYTLDSKHLNSLILYHGAETRGAELARGTHRLCRSEATRDEAVLTDEWAILGDWGPISP